MLKILSTCHRLYKIVMIVKEEHHLHTRKYKSMNKPTSYLASFYIHFYIHNAMKWEKATWVKFFLLQIFFFGN